jgi:hypothetical protein
VYSFKNIGDFSYESGHKNTMLSLPSPEIFPTRVRGVCIGVCIAAQWLFNIIVSQSFPILRVAIGLPAVFGLYAAICAGEPAGVVALGHCQACQVVSVLLPLCSEHHVVRGHALEDNRNIRNASLRPLLSSSKFTCMGHALETDLKQCSLCSGLRVRFRDGT